MNRAFAEGGTDPKVRAAVKKVRRVFRNEHLSPEEMKATFDRLFPGDKVGHQSDRDGNRFTHTMIIVAGAATAALAAVAILPSAIAAVVGLSVGAAATGILTRGHRG